MKPSKEQFDTEDFFEWAYPYFRLTVTLIVILITVILIINI
jgi:hypothetical protein